MSGYNEIMDWAEENIPFSDYTSFRDWQQALDNNFQDNLRNNIYDIFDDADWKKAESEFTSSKRNTQDEEITNIINMIRSRLDTFKVIEGNRALYSLIGQPVTPLVVLPKGFET